MIGQDITHYATVGSSRQTVPPITMVVNWDEELNKGSGREASNGR